jgi:hypothetical protein
MTKGKIVEQFALGLVAPNRNMIWVYGSKFVCYDNLKVVLKPQEKKEHKLKLQRPQQLGYNSYGNVIWSRH